jgi:hypothetical protein
LLPTIGIALDRSAGSARDHDATPADSDPRAHGRKEEREALLAEGTLEQTRDADVVTHSDPAREFDVSPRPVGMSLQGLRLRETEEGRHAFRGDPTLHAAVSALRHRTRTWLRG